MRRLASVAMAALLVVSAVSVVASPATAIDDAFVAVDVEATPDPAPPGTNVTVTTTVENAYAEGSPFTLREVALYESESRNSSKRNAETPATIVGTDDEVSVNVSEEFERTGEYERYVHVKLQSDGEVVTLVRPVTIAVEQNHPSTSLSADDPSPSGRADLSLTVANGLPDTVRGVTIDLASDDVSLQEDRRVVSSLEPGEQTNVTVPARDVEPGQQTVTAEMTYVTEDGESRSVTETLTATVNDAKRPGQITLSGVRTTQDGDELTIRGSASNVGSTNVSGVLVSVADGDAVSPAQDQSRYFVGEVDASDYSSFEVHATLDAEGNETVTVPVEIAYDVDGEHVTRTTELEYTPNATSDDGETQSSSAPVVPVVVGAVVVAAGGLAYRRFR